MLEKNSNHCDWPEINSIICINPGTRLLCDNGNIAIVPVWEEEIIGIVLEHKYACEHEDDQLHVLVDNEVYRIIRTPSPYPEISPYFNIREIKDDGTTAKF